MEASSQSLVLLYTMVGRSICELGFLEQGPLCSPLEKITLYVFQLPFLSNFQTLHLQYQSTSQKFWPDQCKATAVHIDGAIKAYYTLLHHMNGQFTSPAHDMVIQIKTPQHYNMPIKYRNVILFILCNVIRNRSNS